MADTVKCSPNGPYLIKGPFTLIDPTGAELQIPADKNVALCRCGLSANKPFCDGGHSKASFSANEAAKAP